MKQAFGRHTRRLASLRLTFFCVIATAGVLVFGEYFDVSVGIYLVAPFTMMGINLLAALATNPKLYRKTGLLIFHLALAAIAMLAAVDQLTAFKGHVEVTEGSAFDADRVVSRAGPLHRSRLQDVSFVQGPFTIRYGPSMHRRATESTLYILRHENEWSELKVGDDRPLIAAGYRFYTSFNKGFAPVLSYTDSAGNKHTGSVHLPSYPLHDYKQGNEWQPPNAGAPVKIWLQLNEPIYDETKHWDFRLPKNANLLIISDGERKVLTQGEEIAFAGGRLKYEELRSWMGYTITDNWAIPWLLATAVIAVISLAVHIVGNFKNSSWQSSADRLVERDAI